MQGGVPGIRVVPRNDAPLRRDGEFVLYWMIASRRTRWNFGLERAVELANQLEQPLLVLEPLRADYPWASDRFHRFVLDGMRANRDACVRAGVTYHPYLEPAVDAGKGLLASLARHAGAIVTDDTPGFFQRRMVAAAAERIPVRLEAVDGDGIVPLRAPGKVFARAFDFRRHVSPRLPEFLAETPLPDPLGALAGKRRARVPDDVLAAWPAADDDLLEGRTGLGTLPIDHSVGVIPVTGGARAAAGLLDTFLEERLADYGAERNRIAATSQLSAHLHFGHVSAHEIVARATANRPWDMLDKEPATDDPVPPGPRTFLDQLITWRELGRNYCHHVPDADRYETLPGWARQTLAEHARDERPHVYSRADFEEARTHDSLWNAAQRQLRREGRIENYLRMLWGKKILHWSASPESAFATMVALNDRYALDGRDPNSYSGIGWVCGRFDRAWGPERPVFGKIRYMTSANTRRKLRLAEYLERFGDPEPGRLPLESGT